MMDGNREHLEETFSQFKAKFYRRFPDLSIFNCGEINLLKVVLEGLRVNYSTKGKVRTFSFYPNFAFRFFLFLKKIFQKEKYKSKISEITLNEFKQHKILIIDVGRKLRDDDGHLHSVYFENIINHLAEIPLVIYESSLHQDSEISFNEIFNAFIFQNLTNNELILKDQLKKKLIYFKNTHLFSSREFKSVKIAMHLFFLNFLVWNRFLFYLKDLRVCLLTCHYHKEAQLLALRFNGIKTVELQHGLISAKDIFYVFPESIAKIRHKAMFPDMILTYGNFWTEILRKGYEFSHDNIINFGYYLFSAKDNFNRKLTELCDLIFSRKVLLITTQPGLSKEIKSYIQFLSDHHKDDKDKVIVVKPHPRESVESYKSCFSNFFNVLVTELPIDSLLKISNIHLSVYSSCLYDALRVNVPNFCLDIAKSSDYVTEIVDAGIAIKIQLDESPFNVSPQIFTTPAEIFSVPDYSLIAQF